MVELACTIQMGLARLDVDFCCTKICWLKLHAFVGCVGVELQALTYMIC